MNRDLAIKLIKDTFEKPFNKTAFLGFTKNLLNHVEEDTFSHHGNLIWHAYKDYIKSFERVAKYQDPDGNKIDILIIQLKKDTTLEYARTMQRNFIARYLNGSRGGQLKEAALAAFVSPNQKDWRFSLVKMDYKLGETPGGKQKIQEEFTPARRWSFLVGENENSHTAQSSLIPILENDQNDPTLARLEKAFDIETVTKEFFEKYRDLFIQVKEALEEIAEKDPVIKRDFKAKNIDPVDFAKKLLGQIVFLYFLQKKGWFGVERDKPWGSGPKDFLRRLLDKNYGGYQNFFNDIMEPLFYEALARERTDDFYSRFNCKIPFLNGGLFDPINDYDWVHTDILLPNELFSNSNKTKEGDSGDGILDIFDRYNFTVKEDEPLEKEVAVDPEMLGKVFENLLEVKDRKSKGTYYTPREIVHYMCSQSLTNYLYHAANQGNVAYQTLGTDQLEMVSDQAKKGQLDLKVEHNPAPSLKDLEEFIQFGESVGEHDLMVENQGRETETYSYKIPEIIRNNAKLLDEKLAEIKICDPAVGSGAFLVGMMSEIIKARNALSIYLKESRPTIYHLKRNCIQNSLYGVDIDRGAVEIAKLRLWLSLVVEEEDIKQIKPLPNLDYKIVCGNSLLGVEKNLFNEEAFKQLEELKPRFFEETSPRRKTELKNQIDALIYKITSGHENFDFEIYFSEVFHQKGGFDVVIGNPPYVSHDKIVKSEKEQIKLQYRSFEPFADIYCYFLELSSKLQNMNGITAFITSNSYLRAEYGQNLRKYITNNHSIIQIINIENSQFFDCAIVNVAIIIFSKHRHEKNALVVNSPITDNFLDFQNYIKFNSYNLGQSCFRYKIWGLTNNQTFQLVKKIENIGIPLKKYNTKIRLGIATGFNDAFIIDTQKYNKFLCLNSKNKQILKPVLRGSDIFRYGYKSPDTYIILTKNDIDVMKEFPDIYEYFKAFGSSFIKRGAKGKHWTNLRACAFFDDFQKEKIIWIELTSRGKFALCCDEIYLLNSAYFLLPPQNINSKYLLGLLNSNLINFYIKQIAQTSGMGTTRWIKSYIEEFPIPHIKSNSQQPLRELVEQILLLTTTDNYLTNPSKQAQVKNLEREIDQLVYQLYELTPEEIELVENSISN